MEQHKVTTNLNAKLSGEHAVLHKAQGLSVALDMHTTAKIRRDKRNVLNIDLPNLGKNRHFTAQDLTVLYKEYNSRSRDPKSSDLEEYYTRHSNDKIGKEMLPFLTIASRLYSEFGIDLIGNSITIKSDATVRSGFASSAACSAAFTIANIEITEKKFDPQVIIDIAKDGERVVHKKESSGRIDMGPAVLGGYTLFDPSTGRTERLGLSNKLELVASYVGDKPSTSDMIKKVDAEIELHPEKMELMKSIDTCVKIIIEALKREDIIELGRQMDINHLLLASLSVTRSHYDDGLPISRLDKGVKIAKSHGALGAKMVGGGGGGGFIVLARDEHDSKIIVNALREANFKETSKVNVSFQGALQSLE